MKYIKQLSLRLKILISALLIVYIGVWVFVGFGVGRKAAQAAEVKTPIGSLINEDIVPVLADVPNPINGVWFTKEEAKKWNKRVPMSVMIQNHVLARPHSGLSKADIVYEALAEGAITRFVAIFLSTDSKKNLGPVRSARVYYFDWVREYGAAYAYWGANEYVTAQSRKTFGKKDFNRGLIGAPTFFRDPPGGGVHDAYTTSNGLWGIATLRGVNKATKIDSWKFKEDEPAEKPKVSKITVGFDGNADYAVVWKYDKKANDYNRFNGGIAHKDKAFNKQIDAKTVIVQYIKFTGYKEVTPGVSNRTFKTTGSGKVSIYRDGIVVNGSWRKKSSSSRTKFVDSKGKEIPLNRGKIWVEMVPTGSSVSNK